MFDKRIHLIAFLCELNLSRDKISILMEYTFFLELNKMICFKSYMYILNKMICFKSYMYVLIISKRQKISYLYHTF